VLILEVQLPLQLRDEHSPGTPPANTRLGVAVARELLLDMLAIGERAAVEAALERYIAQYAVNSPD
jgi:hypothetical protein